MATKPALGAYVWAPDVNFTTGPVPLIGTATKITPPLAESDEGWNADQKPPAQWENFSINYLTQWASDWVRLGSNAAGADAHPVETDAAGIARVVDLFAGGFSQANSGRGAFGDGSDGAILIGAGTTTLTRDRYATDVDLNATDIIEMNGFRLFVSGTLTIAAGGLIQSNGLDGTDGISGGAGGVASPTGSLEGGAVGGAGGNGGVGAGGASAANSAGGNGGVGGTSTAFAGGSGGSALSPSPGDGGFHHLSGALGYITGLLGTTSFVQGGSGGGGGGGEGADVGGGGGGGGGVIVIHALILDNEGTIRANGGDGGDTQFGAGDDPGGGGGGGGGGIFIVTRQSTGAGTVESTGGAPGVDGDGVAPPAAAGTVGEIIQLSN